MKTIPRIKRTVAAKMPKTPLRTTIRKHASTAVTALERKAIAAAEKFAKTIPNTYVAADANGNTVKGRTYRDAFRRISLKKNAQAPYATAIYRTEKRSITKCHMS